MNTDKYDAHSTALLVIDPYNDFIAEGGKVWPRISVVAEANHCVQHMPRFCRRRGRQGSPFSTRCIVAIVQVTTKPGNSSRRYRSPRGQRHGVQRLIVIGLIAHTCVEATVRFAVERVNTASSHDGNQEDLMMESKRSRCVGRRPL
jgi:hypothetical protein